MRLQRLSVYSLMVLAVLALSGGFVWYAQDVFLNSRNSACLELKPDYRIDLPIPKFHMKDIRGRQVSNDDLKGKNLMIHFFASWCLPCIAELSHIRTLAKSASWTKGAFQIVIIGEDEDIKTLADIFAQDTDLLVLYDDNHSFQKHFGVEKFPETFLADKDSFIHYQYQGSRLAWSSDAGWRCMVGLRKN